MSPPLTHINAPGLARLPAFSHATRAGDLVFVSGTLGTLADGFGLAPGGVAAETSQALANIEQILVAAGGSLGDAVNLKVFLVDMAQFPTMNEAYVPHFSGDPPSRITVGVRELALGACVEIEAIALIPPGQSSRDREPGE